MATFTLTNIDRFPEGTSVAAYPLSNWPNGIVDQGAAPVGSATDTQTMTSGTLTFTGLTTNTNYVAYAAPGGNKHYVYFTPGQDISSQTAIIRQGQSNVVTATELADNAVDSGAIAANAVTTAKINDSAVTTAKINDAAVTGVKIADSTIASTKISALDTDGTLAANSDTKIPSQKAVVTRVNAVAGGVPAPPPTGITYANIDRYIGVPTVTIGLTSGLLRLCAIWLPAGITVTSVSFVSGSTAQTTGTNSHLWFALYNSSSVLLRQTADDTNATWAANTMRTANLASTYVTTYTGLFYLGIMCVAGGGGTQPSLTGINTTSTQLQSLVPLLNGTSSGSLTTTAPDPAAGITVTAATPYCGVA